MLKQIIFISLFIGIINTAFSQKTIERELDAAKIEKIVIASEEIYNIRIISEQTNTIKVYTRIEGETYENVVLSLIEKNGELILKPVYSPYFNAVNDKLAAHKVLAIEMELTVPENIEIEISSTLSSVIAKGKYNSFLAFLSRGNCVFEDFTGNARIQTDEGSITIYAHKNVSGKAFSKKGTIINELSKKGDYFILAESVEGNISLLQTKN